MSMHPPVAIQGEPGDQGETGPRGEQGPPGEQVRTCTRNTEGGVYQLMPAHDCVYKIYAGIHTYP